MGNNLNPTSSLPTAPPATLPSQAQRSLDKILKRKKAGWLRRNSGRLVVLGLVLAVAAGGAFWWYAKRTPPNQEITATVARTNLVIFVAERGELESSRKNEVRCEVEGFQNKIISILEEGKHVNKGDVVVTFDSDQLVKAYADQEVKLKQAEGKTKSTRGDLEVAKNKAEEEIEKAVLALKLAVLDRDKYIAPKGEFDADVQDKKGALALAKKDLEEAKEKLAQFRKSVKKGLFPVEQLRVREADFAQKEFCVARDEAKLMVLEVFTKERQVAELTAKAADAKRALERAKRSGEASIAKAQSDLEAAEVTERLERSTLERAKRQLDNCIVKAPDTGIIVYSKDRWWDDSSRIQAGSMIHFRQGLFSLPDLTQMQMRIKIHEAMVEKVKQGLPVEMRIDAKPEVPLHGTVISVGTLASAEGWMDRNVKEYDTVVKLDDLPTDGSFKPGFTGEAKIFVKELENVLVVPVQAVASKEKQHLCYVMDDRGNVEAREVVIGDNNEKFVQIKDGIKEGEKVVLDARARVAAELKANENTPETAPKQKAPTPSTEPEKSKPPVASTKG
jgi:RND family efflux transporter MFP subunit